MLRPIEEDCIGDAVAVLARGFPERTAAFWEESLRRLTAFRKKTNARPIGHMMMADGCAVGVILTISSRRFDGGTPREVVNLSSWYVDAKYRWLAPRMLQGIVADDSVTYTDLTPNPQTTQITKRIGFRTAAEGVFLFFLPWAALTGRPRARVVPYEDIPRDALSASDRALLAHHRDLGCIAAALLADGCYQPLLFQPTRRKGLPVARLLLAPSRQTVADHIPEIARFLLGRWILFLSFHGDRIAEKVGAFLWNRSASVQVKGNWEPDRFDHTYSELVFLRL